MSLDDLIGGVPEFIRRVGLGLLRLVERVVPAIGDPLEPYAVFIGWAMFGVAAVAIVMCITGLFRRR